MRAAVLAALAVCAAELAGTLVADAAPADTADTPTPLTPVPQTSAPPTYAPPTEAPPTPVPHTAAPPTDAPATDLSLTVHNMSDHDSINKYYSAPQEWVISCATYNTLWVNVSIIYYKDCSLELEGEPMTYGFNQHVICPSSGKVSLMYTPYNGEAHALSVSWYSQGTQSPGTPPAASSVHYMSDHGSVADIYGTPQEWVISCFPNYPLMMEIGEPPSGYSLKVDGRLMTSNMDAYCPSSGKMSLMYTPDDGQSHAVGVRWQPYAGTPTATLTPETSAPPTPSPVTVHSMTDHDSMNTTYSTPQEWVISCLPDSTLLIDVSYTPFGYNLTLDGKPIDFGDDHPVTCPSSGKMPLLYTPYDSRSHIISLQWYPATAAPKTRIPETRVPPTLPVTVHNMSDHDSITKYYSTPQEWVISCATYSTLWVNVTYLCHKDCDLTLDGEPMSLGFNQHVICPSSGKVSLLYTPYNGEAYSLSVSWYSQGTQSPGTPPAASSVHYMSDHGSFSDMYGTPQKWVISCSPHLPLMMIIGERPSGYSLTVDGRLMTSNMDAYCPSSGKMSLLYIPDDGQSHAVGVWWKPYAAAPTTTLTPETSAPPTPSPVTVHSMTDHDSVSGSYSTPQEWVISCLPDSTLLIDVSYTPLGYTLTLDSKSIDFGDDQPVICPSSGKVPLWYTPYDGESHIISLQWYPATAAPNTRIPETQVPPTLVPATVHSMSDHDSVNTTSSTPQEWVISCATYSTVWIDISYTPSGYDLTLDGKSVYSGSNEPVICPSSGKVSLLYAPYDGQSHTLLFSWVTGTSLHVVTDHYVSDHGSVSSMYITAQEWVISCTPYSYLDVTVTQLPGTLTADTMTLSRGQRKVQCPSTGQVRLSYVPSSGTSQPLIVSWAPEGGGDESQSLSPLLIVVIATVGVLVLVCVTVAVYCGCRGQAADRKADSSSVRCQEYDNVALRCVPPSEGKQPVSEMEEQLLLVDRRL